jgi:putative tryptophan/tyrosine transport system substrate-binding protein
VKRRAFLFATSGLLAPFARAQTPTKLRRVGWLTGGSPQTHARLLEAFRAGMRELGWSEERNYTLELRWAEGKLERLPELAADLVRSKPDVIITAANVVHLAVRKETSTIPIVMATGADPIASGLVTNLARPGGNVTGLTGFFEATPVKMLELAAALVGRGARIVVLADLHSPFSRGEYRPEIERAAKAFGFRTEYAVAGTADELRHAIAELAKNRPAVLVLPAGAMFFAVRDDLVKRAGALKVPVIYPFEECVELGGLMSYAVSLPETYRRAAGYVDKILRGAKPGDLPIEQPTRLSLAVNLKTAKQLGITIPAAVLVRADRVIE